jgi:WD40 repeat protein
MQNHIGQQIGNYQLNSLLGRGTFGDVYLGTHVHDNTPAAVKVLQTRLTADDLKVFINEASTSFRLQHPNIVRLLDFGLSSDNTPFLVMAYAVNGSMRQRLPKGTRLSLDKIIFYVNQVASALQYAHDKRLIHRDIKPENMLLGPNNEVWLSDFGLALIARSTFSQSEVKAAGTIYYMAPEQIQSHPRPASDQYALGTVVYEWLSGDRPFSGSFTEVAAKQVLNLPPPLHEKVPNVSPEVEQVVMRALAKDPKQRFPNVMAFATALEQASQPHMVTASPILVSPLNQESRPGGLVIPSGQSVPPADIAMRSTQLASPTGIDTSANQASQPPELWTPANQALQPSSAYPPVSQAGVSRTRGGISRRAILLGLGVAGLAIVGGGATILAFSQGQQQPLIPGQTPTPAPSPSPTSSPVPLGSLLYTYRGHSAIVNAAAWNPVWGTGRPASSRIASGSDDKTVQVWDATNGSHVFIYRGHNDLVEAVAWSPDGKRIASASFDKTVQVWNAVDGGNVFTYKGHADVVDTVIWSPDGRRIASGSYDKTVQVWNAADGGNVFTYKGHADIVHTIAWSPDGKRIASASFDKTVQVWNAADGSNFFIYRGHSAPVNAVAWSPDGTRIASGGNDKTVQVWDAANGNLLYTYHGHTGIVDMVAWSPDGKRIASSSDDNTVQVWDAANGSHAFTYRKHSAEVRTVAWSPDSRLIASGSIDKTVQVWGAG